MCKIAKSTRYEIYSITYSPQQRHDNDMLQSQSALGDFIWSFVPDRVGVGKSYFLRKIHAKFNSGCAGDGFFLVKERGDTQHFHGKSLEFIRKLLRF